jgi:transposase
MEVSYPRCAGLDVHKKTVVACVMTPEGQETRTFSTMTEPLLQLADWLVEQQVTHVAMESSGVYWKPVYNLLEGLELTLWVINAHHLKIVPGRKTDVKDAAWIADLLRHGLLRPSFIPDRGQRELRELVRYRRNLIQERSRVANRIQQVLEGANIKLASVASDVLGKSGREMLQALAAGEEDPATLAQLARGTLRGKREALRGALRGLMGAHQRLLLQSHLRHLTFLEAETEQLNQEVAQRVAPFEQAIKRLDEVPGIARTGAEEVVAELGTDMSRFPSPGHCASWAGLCPGNNQSGGKRKSGRTRHGNQHLEATLVLAAHAAAHTKDTYPAAQYHRLAARRGAKRAAVAVAHTLLVDIYCMLRDGTHYGDLGGDYFATRDRKQRVHRAVRELQRQGYRVTLEAA